MHLGFHSTPERKCTNIHRWLHKFPKTLRLMHRGLPSLARLALGPCGLGPGLALQRRHAHLRQLLRLLLQAHAYNYRREDLHEDANARLN
jgi:hypothetical protein